MTPADVHTIGVLVGAMEGDATARFGSLGGFYFHSTVALAYGLVDIDLNPTERGRAFFARHNLASLPAGRAYLWIGKDDAERVLAAAFADLNGEAS